MKKLQKIKNCLTLSNVLSVTLLIAGIAAFTIPCAFAAKQSPSLPVSGDIRLNEGPVVSGAGSREYRGPFCETDINGVCVTVTAFKPTPLTSAQCKAEVAKGYITALKGNNYPCFAKNNDYWVGAMKACNDADGRLATRDEMYKLINPYTNSQLKGEFKQKNANNTIKDQKIAGILSGREFLNSTNYNEVIKVQPNAMGNGFTANSKIYTYAGRNRATKILEPAYAICVTP